MHLIFFLTCLVLQDGLRAPEEPVEKQEEKKRSHKKIVYEEAEGMYIDEEQKVRQPLRQIRTFIMSARCITSDVIFRRKQQRNEEHKVNHLNNTFKKGEEGETHRSLETMYFLAL